MAMVAHRRTPRHGIINRGVSIPTGTPGDGAHLFNPRDTIAPRVGATLVSSEMEVDLCPLPTRRIVAPGAAWFFTPIMPGDDLDPGLLPAAMAALIRFVGRIRADRHVMAALALREEHVLRKNPESIVL